MDPLKELKDFDAAHQLALIKKLKGRENLWAVLRDEKEIILQDKLQILFDRHGRRRPHVPEKLQSNVCNPYLDLYLKQPTITEDFCAERLRRLHQYLGDTGVTEKNFWMKVNELLKTIQSNKQINNILISCCLPVVLPQLTTDDLGTALEQYLEGVGKSYAKTFSDWNFYNHYKGELAGEVSIAPESRHDQLINRMKQGPVPGIHFPNPLQGFSVNADREQMSTLPEGFILSGMDTPIAMAMYPDILARDHKTPVLKLAALSLRSDGGSLLFEARVKDLALTNYSIGLAFISAASLIYSVGSCSGSLLFIG